MNLVLVLLFLAHILGDFYLQTDKMAKNKEKPAQLLKHGGIYTLCMGVILIIGLPFTKELLFLALGASVLHLGIDLLKITLGKKLSHVFLLDQAVHILSLILIWRLWGTALTVRGFILCPIDWLPALPVTILLGFLSVLLPVGVWIGKGEKNAGQAIGYLERVLILLFLMYGQFTAIAFVLTAKSVARYKEIEEKRIRAEDFLIGTLQSSAAACVIALLLGLIGW